MQLENGINKRDLKQSEISEALDLEEGTFDNHFKRFMDLYGFEQADFKEGNVHIFKKEWNGLFYVLMKCLKWNPTFDRRKRDLSENLDAITLYNDELLSEVDESLSREWKLKIMSHPVYLATTAELMMLGKVQDKLADWMSIVGVMPIRVRTAMWQVMNDSIDVWIQSLCVSVAELSELDEILRKDELLAEDVRTTQLGRLDLLLVDYLRNEIRTVRERESLEEIHTLNELLRESDHPLVRELVDKLFERIVAPVLDAEENKKDEVLKKLLQTANNLASGWKQIDDSLNDFLKLVADMPGDDKKREQLLKAIAFVQDIRATNIGPLGELSTMAEKLFNYALSFNALGPETPNA